MINDTDYLQKELCNKTNIEAYNNLIVYRSSFPLHIKTLLTLLFLWNSISQSKTTSYGTSKCWWINLQFLFMWVFMHDNGLFMPFIYDIWICSLQQKLSISIHQTNNPPDMDHMVFDTCNPLAYMYHWWVSEWSVLPRNRFIWFALHLAILTIAHAALLHY